MLTRCYPRSHGTIKPMYVCGMNLLASVWTSKKLIIIAYLAPIPILCSKLNAIPFSILNKFFWVIPKVLSDPLGVHVFVRDQLYADTLTERNRSFLSAVASLGKTHDGSWRCTVPDRWRRRCRGAIIIDIIFIRKPLQHDRFFTFILFIRWNRISISSISKAEPPKILGPYLVWWTFVVSNSSTICTAAAAHFCIMIVADSMWSGFRGVLGAVHNLFKSTFVCMWTRMLQEGCVKTNTFHVCAGCGGLDHQAS